MVSPRDAYLAYQAEIGTEEVILSRPWIRKGAVATPKEVPHFFQSIAQTLVSEPLSISPFKKSTAAQEEILQAPAIIPIPEFKDLDAYWNYLNEEYPKWFASTSLSDRLLARAEGISNPVLTVVELSPVLSDVPKVFGGETGLLLNKMMKAIHLERSQLYLTSVMKTPAPGGRSWPRKDIARMLPAFFQELRLAACSTVLLMGEACAQTVLRRGSSLESMRKQAMEAEGFMFVTSYHPADLEKNQELKRNAWEDLKWLQSRLGMREAG